MNNQLKTVFLLGALSALLIGIGGALGPGYFQFFIVMAVGMNLIGYFFSDKIVLRMNRAREIAPDEAPELHQMVRELATAAQIETPRLYYVAQPQPNAFATGRNPKNGVIAVTDGIVRMLSPRELRGVLAHEMSHIKNRDILVATIAAALAAAITYIAHVVQWGAMFGGMGRSDDDEGQSPFAALALAIVAPIAATLIQLGVSRSREYLADETGARLSGDPEALAAALEKLEQGAQAIPMPAAEPATASLFIVSPFAGRRSLASLFSTHPPMDERIRRLRAMAGHRAA
jgi:heat shock protein HtpX